jgi:hypothetical protein
MPHTVVEQERRFKKRRPGLVVDAFNAILDGMVNGVSLRRFMRLECQSIGYPILGDRQRFRNIPAGEIPRRPILLGKVIPCCNAKADTKPKLEYVSHYIAF